MDKSISFIIPAYNEEKNLKEAIDSVYKIAHNRVDDFEVLIFNDNSTDKTGEIADQLSKKHKRVKAIHNETNRGLGYNYKKGVELAEKEYVMLIPGDNEITAKSIMNIIDNIGKADIIIPYHGNMEERPFIRQLLSQTFTSGINLLFWLKIKYYNGPVVHKSEIIKRYPIKTNSFAYQVEGLVKVLKDGYSYYHTPLIIQQTGRPSSAFKPKRIAILLSAIARIFWEVQVKNSLKKGLGMK